MQRYHTAEGITLCGGDLDWVLSTLNGGINSLIWCDDEFELANPALKITRRSMNRPKKHGGRGPGGALLHQHGVSFITGPGIACFLKEGTDPTLIEWQQERGLIGEVLTVGNPAEMLAALERSGRKLYATDCYGPGFDRFSRVPEAMFADVNRKSKLKHWVRPSLLPIQEDYDGGASALPRKLFDSVSGDGQHDIFIKTDNGEYDGGGVSRIAAGGSADSFFERAARVAADLAERIFQANRQIAESAPQFPELSLCFTVQRFVPGPFRSFHVYLDPGRPDLVQMLGITDKFSDPLSGRGLGNLNFPLTQELVASVAPAIIEIVSGIRRRYPQVFGFFYCDYVVPSTEDRPVVLIDPGLRPSGNTAACMTALRIVANGQPMPYLHSDFRFETGRPGMPWAEVAPMLGSLCEPAEVWQKARGILPIGWNPIQGTFRGVVVAPTTDGIVGVEEEVLRATNSKRG